jgi:DNA-binding response OmpR family regulator
MNNKWILVVEDDVFIDKAYRAKFSHEEINTEYASDGVLAMELLMSKADNPPALVLLDLMLPKKNGFEVLEEMKADERLKNVPVIILSNLGQESDVKKGMLLGANEYLVKAETKINSIIEKVREYLAK